MLKCLPVISLKYGNTSTTSTIAVTIDNNAMNIASLKNCSISAFRVEPIAFLMPTSFNLRDDFAVARFMKLKKVPGVMNASTVEQNLMQKGNGSSTYGINWPGKVPDVMIDFAIRTVDYDLIETLGMQITNGRSFSKAYGAEENGLIFNEHAIKLMGLKNPIGTKVNLWGEDKTIIGVVKDFHISSLHEPIAPLVFRFAPGRTSTFMVKIAPRKERETIAQIQELYNKFNPGYLFEYKFLDEVYQAQYISEQRVSVISKYFAALAIIISCLGLFGLATFNAEVRTKEIGIRKVLGASVSNVMVMLSKDYCLVTSGLQKVRSPGRDIAKPQRPCNRKSKLQTTVKT